MMTLLPSPIFSESARLLDSKRLERQMRDNRKVLRILLRTNDWQEHPVTKMWKGYEWALLNYQRALVSEWRRRGNADNGALWAAFEIFSGTANRNPNKKPFWLGDAELHLSHQAHLVWEDPWHYAPLFPDVAGSTPMYYPEVIINGGKGCPIYVGV